MTSNLPAIEKTVSQIGAHNADTTEMLNQLTENKAAILLILQNAQLEVEQVYLMLDEISA